MTGQTFTKHALALLCTALWAAPASAQGEDSRPAERDLAVIATLLPGQYDNNNQTYFDRRTKADAALHHPRTRAEITASSRSAGAFEFAFVRPDIDDNSQTGVFTAALEFNAKLDAVRMTLTGADQATCHYQWRREPTQFVAQQAQSCAAVFPRKMILSEQQLWLFETSDNADNPIEMHRARSFECYADMPGVGGGRPDPYARFDGIKLHDRGATHWFDSTDTPPRRLGITLWQVDWPINNYEGVFTRDSLVIYISEKTEEATIEHGYAFVEADATRIGINLKWILATCFMESNAVARPSM